MSVLDVVGNTPKAAQWLAVLTITTCKHPRTWSPGAICAQAFAELNAELGINIARDRVASWFLGAGVPAVRDDSHWINSD